MLNSLALIDLLAPTLFLGCACFVWLGTRLSLATVVNVLRLSSIDRAQVTDALTGQRSRQYLDRPMRQKMQRAERRVATHPPRAAALAVAERLRREIELGARKALRESKGARHAIPSASVWRGVRPAFRAPRTCLERPKRYCKRPNAKVETASRWEGNNVFGRTIIPSRFRREDHITIQASWFTRRPP